MRALVKPVITEKSIMLTTQGVFTFETLRGANKYEVKEAVEKLFKVNVTNVTSQKTHQAAKRTGRKRTLTPRADRKLVRVTLKKGQSIALFDLKEEN